MSMSLSPSSGPGSTEEPMDLRAGMNILANGLEGLYHNYGQHC